MPATSDYDWFNLPDPASREDSTGDVILDALRCLLTPEDWNTFMEIMEDYGLVCQQCTL